MSLKAALSLTSKVLHDTSLILKLIPSTQYTVPCPIIHATLGQHTRHLLHHITLPLTAAASAPATSILDYDIRARGDEIETCPAAAQTQITELLATIASIPPSPSPSITHACTVTFSLTATPNSPPTPFPTTVEREVAFGAHHALHHLSMMKVLAEGPVGGGVKGELPGTFGKAPSTNAFEGGGGC